MILLFTTDSSLSSDMKMISSEEVLSGQRYFLVYNCYIFWLVSKPSACSKHGVVINYNFFFIKLLYQPVDGLIQKPKHVVVFK
jgi:hypothetical protein